MLNRGRSLVHGIRVCVLLSVCLSCRAFAGSTSEEFFEFLRSVVPRQGAIEVTYIHTTTGWRQINAFDATSHAWFSAINRGAVGVNPSRKLFNGWNGAESIEERSDIVPGVTPVGPAGEWPLNFVYLIDVLERTLEPSAVERDEAGHWIAEFQFPGGMRTNHRPSSSTEPVVGLLPNRLWIDPQGRIEKAEFTSSSGTRQVTFEYSPDSPPKLPVPIEHRLTDSDVYRVESIRYFPEGKPDAFDIESVKLVVDAIAPLDAAADAAREPVQLAPGQPVNPRETMAAQPGSTSLKFNQWLAVGGGGALAIAILAMIWRRIRAI